MISLTHQILKEILNYNIFTGVLMLSGNQNHPPCEGWIQSHTKNQLNLEF